MAVSGGGGPLCGTPLSAARAIREGSTVFTTVSKRVKKCVCRPCLVEVALCVELLRLQRVRLWLCPCNVAYGHNDISRHMTTT